MTDLFHDVSRLLHIYKFVPIYYNMPGNKMEARYCRVYYNRVHINLKLNNHRKET